MRRSVTMGAIFLLFALSALRVFQVWDDLPPNMASHFGASGDPNGFMGRDNFFVFYATITGFVTALLLGIPLLIQHAPPGTTNLPQLSEGASRATRDAAIQRIGGAFHSYSLVTVLFALGVLELVVRANLSRRGLDNGPFFLMLGGYMLFNLVWTVWLITRLAKPTPA